MPRLRDTATVLVPATRLDPHSELQVPDWTQTPTEHTTAFHGEQDLNRAGLREEEDAAGRWTGYLPPSAAVFTTDVCRIRWRDVVYAIDGPVAERVAGGRLRFLVVALKPVLTDP